MGDPNAGAMVLHSGADAPAGEPAAPKKRGYARYVSKPMTHFTEADGLKPEWPPHVNLRAAARLWARMV
eukprot:3261092-Pyramimonas_sp.AAC.1